MKDVVREREREREIFVDNNRGENIKVSTGANRRDVRREVARRLFNAKSILHNSIPTPSSAGQNRFAKFQWRDEETKRWRYRVVFEVGHLGSRTTTGKRGESRVDDEEEEDDRTSDDELIYRRVNRP